MRILVNIASLAPPRTGIGWYTFHLLQHLLRCENIDDVIGVGIFRRYSKNELINIVMPQSTKTNSPTQLPVRAFTALKPYLSPLRGYKQLLQQYTFPRTSQLANYIYWEPNYILKPFSGGAVPTIHDLSHIHHPEYHPASRTKYLTRHLQHSIATAQHIIAVSEFTRQQIMAVFSVPEHKISIVSPGVSTDFRPYLDQEIATTLQRYHLKPGYILSVGTIEPRKNTMGLARAWLRLPKAVRQKHPLVVVGCKGWQMADIEKRLHEAERHGELIRLGYVCQQDLPKIYAGAQVMAYVSFYEGFGMPIAEAMACGTAVLTSNCTSMPEVAGNCAALVNPWDDDDILNGLSHLLEDDELCHHYEQTGLQQIARYSWQNSFKNLMKTFTLAGQ